MCGECVGVAPVIGELAFQLADERLPFCDRGFYAFEIRLPTRDRPRRGLSLFRFWWLRLGRLLHTLFLPEPNEVGPTAVVRDERLVLDRKGPVGDRVQQRAVV